MTLLPRSLFGRLALLLLAVVAMALVATILFFRQDRLTLLARGRDHDVFERAIDVQVSRLRKLIEPDPANPRYIQTVWGFGYVFVPDDGDADAGPESAPP